jgi:uncharacterized protein (DUF58 family)
MLTTRAWWFLFLSSVALLVGVVGVPVVAGGVFVLVGSTPLTLLGLTLLLWFAAVWALFVVRIPLAVRRLRVAREVRDERGPVPTLWAGRTYEVRVRLEGGGLLPLPLVVAADRPPFAVEHVSGAASADGPVGGEQPIEITYRIRCPAAGLARFEGVRVQVADVQGFFYHAAFVPGVVILRVLPPLAESRPLPPTLKRDNLLPPPGVHRLRRAGAGGELHDLRDYMPGDPPKTIAWKVSARRDRLITKEYESEAPIHCTVFVDTSNSVRVPTVYGKALGRLLEIAAAVLQANADARDLTGLTLFDEQGASGLPPDRSPAHVTEALQILADAAALAPAAYRADPDPLTPLAYAFAREVYPHLLAPSVNRVPFWMQFLDSFPGRSRRAASVMEFLHRKKNPLYHLATWLIPLAAVVVGAGLCYLHFLRPSLTLFLATLPLVGFGISLIPLLMLLVTLIATARLRRLGRWRKQLAAIFAERYGLGPGGLATLLEDDDQYALHVQRFLAEHHVPYTLPLYDRIGRYLFAAQEKVPVLAKALLRAVGRGRDNELFVLLADLLELDDALEPLLKAVRVAVGRRHHVLVVIPWPHGMRPPEEEPPAPVRLAADGMPLALRRATTRRFHHAYHRVRRALIRLGVQVVCARGDDPVPLILERINRLRVAGSKR